jgi:hypothetical protein
MFDGSGLELKDSFRGNCDNCWGFIFYFESSHAGYGDRTGQVLAQVITPHAVDILVKEGSVELALMDGEWDMINQGILED